MPSSRFFAMLAAVSVALLSLGKTDAATPKESRDVQALGSFPALQKLSAKNDGTLRAYLARVSSSYRKAGYHNFARELAQASSLVVLFGQPELAESPEKLKKARSVLRDLKQSLARNNFIALPATGETLPDYLRIGAAFLEGADVALKNLKAHKNVATSLRNHKGAAWITDQGNGRYTGSGSTSSSYVSASGLIGGTLSASSSFALSFGSGTETMWSLFSSTSSSNSGGMYSSGAVIELVYSGSLVTTGPTVPGGSSGNSVIVPVVGIGTFDATKLGAGFIELNGNLVTSFSGVTAIVDGNLIVSSPSVLSSLKNGIILYGNGTLTIQIPGFWAIFPPGVEIPANFSQLNPIPLTWPSLINGVEYPAGTRLALFNFSNPLPDGATALSIPATISAAPTPAPSPTPSGT